MIAGPHLPEPGAARHRPGPGLLSGACFDEKVAHLTRAPRAEAAPYLAASGSRS